MKTWKIIATLAGWAVLALASAGWGQDSLGVSRIGRIPSYRDWSACQKIVVQGNYAYIIGLWNLDVGGLYILDISNPAQPLEVGGYVPRGLNCRSIALHGDYLFVWGIASFQDPHIAVFILDVSNPRAPELVGYYRQAHVIHAMTISGDYLYLAYDDYRLLIWDISDPLHPREAGSCETSIYFSPWLHVIGDTLLSVKWGVSFVDVSDPESPTELGFIHSSELVYDARLIGNYLYLAEYESMFVLDITDVSSPDTIWRWEGPDHPIYFEMALGNNYLYVTSYYGLRTYDVSDPASPELVDSLMSWGNGFPVEIQGDYLYTNFVENPDFVVMAGAFCVLSLSDPAHPAKVGWFKPPDNSRSVCLDGDYAYVADYNLGLRIIDIADPTSPHDVSYLHMRNIIGVRALHVTRSGAYAIVSEGRYGVEIIDVSSPVNPQMVGRYSKIPFSFIKSTMLGDLVVSTEVLDISDPFLPFAISEARIPLARDIVIQDSIAYVSADSVIVIVDLSDPINPEVVGRFSWGSGHEGLTISGNYLYSAVGGYGVIIYDITRPLEPSQVCYIYTPGYARRVAVAYNYVLVADDTCGLRVYDVSDFGNPREVGYYDDAFGRTSVQGTAFDVAVRGSTAFVANEHYFDVFDCSAILSVPPLSLIPHPSSLLLSAFPNPFNDRISIRFTLPKPGPVHLEVYDPLGRRVMDLIPGSWLGEGEHTFNWDAVGTPTGNYLLKATARGWETDESVVKVK